MRTDVRTSRKIHFHYFHEYHVTSFYLLFQYCSTGKNTIVPEDYKSIGVEGNVTIGGRFMMCKSEICDVVTTAEFGKRPGCSGGGAIACGATGGRLQNHVQSF